METTHQNKAELNDAGQLTAASEIVIVGAAFAGLAAALMLGRAQRQVLVLGDGPARNAESLHAHNLPTREGASPQELLDTSRAEVDALPTVTLATSVVTQITTDPDRGFLLTTTDGRRVRARQVVLATGVRDALPRIPGLPALWGRRAHSCPFCDAAPYAGRRLALLADDASTPRLTALLHGWTDRIVALDPADVTGVDEVDDAVIIRTTAGDHPVDGVFVHAMPLPRTGPVDHLPLERRGSFIATDPDGRTSMAGLWAVGDCGWADGAAMPGGQVLAAMAAGSRAGISIILQLAGIEMPAPPPRSLPDPSADHGDEPAHHGADGHEHGDADEDLSLTAFWEGHYGASERVWTGRPNMGLVSAAEDLSPGSALDLGAGEGGDAVWLAARGWRVTAADVSSTAIARLARAAAEHGVSEQITGLVRDLGAEPVEGAFDLVVAAYLLSPVEIPRSQILRQARDAVADGGTLVILSHLHVPGAPGGHDMDLPDVEQQLADLQLDDGWDVIRAEPFQRRAQMRDGTVVTMADTAIVARRATRANR